MMRTRTKLDGLFRFKKGLYEEDKQPLMQKLSYFYNGKARGDTMVIDHVSEEVENDFEEVKSIFLKYDDLLEIYDLYIVKLEDQKEFRKENIDWDELTRLRDMA